MKSISTGEGLCRCNLYEDTEKLSDHRLNPTLLNGATEFGTKPDPLAAAFKQPLLTEANREMVGC